MIKPLSMPGDARILMATKMPAGARPGRLGLWVPLPMRRTGGVRCQTDIAPQVIAHPARIDGPWFGARRPQQRLNDSDKDPAGAVGSDQSLEFKAQFVGRVQYGCMGHGNVRPHEDGPVP